MTGSGGRRGRARPAGTGALLVVMALIAATLAGCAVNGSAAAEKPPACNADAVPPQAGVSSLQIDVDGQQRTYSLAVPTLVSGATASPAVFVFPGPTAVTGGFDAAVGLSEAALSRGFVVVQPQPSSSGSWAIPGVPGADDVRFVEALLYDLGRRVCLDPKRLYATGFDNGAGFAMWLTCTLPRFAAVAPVAGVNLVRPCEGKPVTVVAFHDNADPVIPFSVPAGSETAASGVYLGDVLVDMAAWAKRSRCKTSYSIEQLTDRVAQVTWPSCASGTQVVLYSVTGVGHDWPGAQTSVASGAAPAESTPTDSPPSSDVTPEPSPTDTATPDAAPTDGASDGATPDSATPEPTQAPTDGASVQPADYSSPAANGGGIVTGVTGDGISATQVILDAFASASLN